jgi:hypothetical protein
VPPPDRSQPRLQQAAVDGELGPIANRFSQGEDRSAGRWPAARATRKTSCTTAEHAGHSSHVLKRHPSSRAGIDPDGLRESTCVSASRSTSATMARTLIGVETL